MRQRPALLDDWARNGFRIPHGQWCDHPCGSFSDEFTMLGATFRVHVPGCQWSSYHGKQLVSYVSFVLGVEVLHRRKFESLIQRVYPYPMRGEILMQDYLLPAAYEIDANHRYFCIRDIVKLLPPRPRCPCCGGRPRWGWGEPKRLFHSGAVVTLCSKKCEDKMWDREWRAHKKHKRERKWLKTGREKLKEVRSLLAQPSRLEVLRSQRGESEPDSNSPRS